MGGTPKGTPKGTSGKGKGEGKGKGKFGKGKGKADPEQAAVSNRTLVVLKLKEIANAGVELSAEVKSKLFASDPQVALGVLIALRDRSELPDPNLYLLKAMGNQEAYYDNVEAAPERVKPALPNPGLFKLRFGQALEEEDKKGGKKGKGKGKGKGKDKGKGKGKDDGKGKGEGNGKSAKGKTKATA